MAQFNLDQDSYRFGNDGTEAAHTWLAATNIAINVGTGGSALVGFNTTFLLRLLIQEFGGKTGSDVSLQLQYQINSDGWNTVTAISPVRLVDSSNLTNGNDTTQRLGVGTFITDNNWVFDYGGGVTNTATLPTFNSGRETELLVAIQVNGTTLNDGDQVYIQAVYNGGTALDSYTNTPWMLISKAATTYYQTVTGAITPAGTLSKIPTFIKSIVGNFTPVGQLTKIATFVKSIAGAITPSGVLSSQLVNWVVDIDHETGDVSQWDSVTGTATAQAAAALEGSYGLECIIASGDTSIDCGNKTTSISTNDLRFYFRVDPNSMNYANNFNMVACRVSTSDVQQRVVEVQFRVQSDVWNFAVWARQDDGTWQYSGYVATTDAPHEVEVAMQRETADGNNDGTLDWWVDGVEQTSYNMTTIQNYNLWAGLDGIRAGMVSRSSSGFYGTLYVDKIVLNDTLDQIGQYASTFYQTITGAITPSGVLTKASIWLKSIAGAITPAGTLSKVTTWLKTVTGSITPAGTLSRAATWLKTVTGSITPSGVLTKATTWLKTIAGTIAPAGILTRLGTFYKTLTGAITPTGSLSFGTVFSILVTGAINFVGNVTSASVIGKLIEGSITPSGTLSKVATFVKSIAGQLTPAGLLQRAATYYKSITGSLQPTGLLTKVATFYKSITGSITPSGVVTYGAVFPIIITGAITPSGTLSLSIVIGLLIQGSITPSGAMTMITTFVISVLGSITPTGTLTKLGTFYKVIAGAISPTGLLTRLGTYYKTITGSITPAGNLIVLLKGATEWLVNLILKRRKVTDLTLYDRQVGDLELQPRSIATLNLPALPGVTAGQPGDYDAGFDDGFS